MNVFFDEVRQKSAQFPPYQRNAVSILNGVSVITMKTEALGVHCSLFNAVFFHSWVHCVVMKGILKRFVVVDVGMFCFI